MIKVHESVFFVNFSYDHKDLAIKVSYLASSNLQNLFLEVWNLIQMYYFWIGQSRLPEECSNK